jgi:5-methylcytosine-specific restriction endonuclease McrA
MCGALKPLAEFSKSSKSGDGRRQRCKLCESECERGRPRLHRKRDAEKTKARVKRWRDENRARFSQTSKAWRESRPEAMRAQSSRAYTKARNDPRYRLNAAIKSRLYVEMTGGAKARQRTFDLLGYTAEELIAHVSALFQQGMTWNNYGRDGWHIDHIRPLASFQYSTPQCPEFRQAWALANLQPLWADDNRRKHAKWQDEKSTGVAYTT